MVCRWGKPNDTSGGEPASQATRIVRDLSVSVAGLGRDYWAGLMSLTQRQMLLAVLFSLFFLNKIRIFTHVHRSNAGYAVAYTAYPVAPPRPFHIRSRRDACRCCALVGHLRFGLHKKIKESICCGEEVDAPVAPHPRYLWQIRVKSSFYFLDEACTVFLERCMVIPFFLRLAGINTKSATRS